MSSEAVTLRRGGPTPMPGHVLDRARTSVSTGGAPDLDAATEVARDMGRELPGPSQGDTLTLWEALASLGAVDLTMARVVEPHLDALAILHEARRHGQIEGQDWHRHAEEWESAALWQVYAAEGSGRLHAAGTDARGFTLEGVKPWCSLADRASHALVTAWVDDENRRLFAVDLRHEGVTASVGSAAGQSTSWAARGLTAVRSTGLAFSAVPAIPVGEAQWYLTRPGFAWGGAGVAAIWYGATVALARRLREGALCREPDQVALLHLGAADAAMARARAVLADAAAVADATDTEPKEAVMVAARVRQVVADSAEEVVQRVGHALGPAPLTGDEAHARRVADLTVYLRQHHAERDLVSLGGSVLTKQPGWTWW